MNTPFSNCLILNLGERSIDAAIGPFSDERLQRHLDGVRADGGRKNLFFDVGEWDHQNHDR